MKWISIGRASDNDVVYNNSSISSYHADIFLNEGHLIITDHSTNGTWVNGRKVHNSSCGIVKGDKILFPGNVIFNWQIIERELMKETVRLDYSHSEMKDDTEHVHWNRKDYETPGGGREIKPLSLSDAIASVFTHYADFSGRARRSEFWWFYLFNTILAALLIFFPIASIIWSLVTIIPGLAVSVRRVQDLGKSGLNLLFALIPLVGWILLIVWYCQEGEPRSNQYGKSPKSGI